MTAKEKLLERYPNADIFWYPSLNLYGNISKIWIVKIGEYEFEEYSESKVCKTAMANMPVDK